MVEGVVGEKGRKRKNSIENGSELAYSSRKATVMNALRKQIPKHYELFNPLLKALRELGGSATVAEIEDQVAKDLSISEELLAIPAKSHPSKSEIMYRLAWARTYLKNFGVIDNSQRGVWVLTNEAKKHLEVDTKEVLDFVQALSKERKKTKPISSIDLPSDTETPDLSASWQQTLIETVLDTVSPSGFERLIQRMLRESGFRQVEVTGRPSDGGIDGKGIAKIHGFMSFHVLFQAKRYKGTVGAPQIRDFRGAMIGKGDKGLFITTGTFTKDAKAEASRDGATPIDLIDGEELAEKLKGCGLGVSTTTIEKVEVDVEWFSGLED